MTEEAQMSKIQLESSRLNTQRHKECSVVPEPISMARPRPVKQQAAQLLVFTCSFVSVKRNSVPFHGAESLL